MKTTTSLLFVVTLFFGFVSLAEERPNVLWITAEDMSPTLGCYGDKDAITPHLSPLRRA